MRRMLFIIVLVMVPLGAFAADQAPMFIASDRSGKVIELEQLSEDNEMVLLNFWMAGCHPCAEVLPYVDAFQGKYAEAGLASVVVYVYCEITADIGEHFWEQHNYNLPVVMDCDGTISCCYSVCSYPHTVMVRDGEIVYELSGYEEGSELEIQQTLHKLLHGKPLPAGEVINLPGE